jgi:hypothetical protein
MILDATFDLDACGRRLRTEFESERQPLPLEIARLLLALACAERAARLGEQEDRRRR